MLSRPAAVLFDFDGVIADSEPLHFRAFRETARTVGIDLSEVEYYRNLIGYDDRGAWQVIFSLYKRKLPNDLLIDLMRRKTAVVQRLISLGEFKPLPGIEAFLEHLDQLRIPAAIYSGALRAELEPMLAGLFLRKHFQMVTTADDVPVAKPNPSGYILTMDVLSKKIHRPLLASQCLIIEDSVRVATNAQNVGFNVVGVTTSAPANQWPAVIATVQSLDQLRFEDEK